MQTLDVAILAPPDCPHASATHELAADVMSHLGVSGKPRLTTDPAEAPVGRNPQAGNPILLVNGRPYSPPAEGDTRSGGRNDIDGSGAGVPPRWLVEAALLSALSPKGYLFLCVANSARSQLAEALARHWMDPDVAVQSAGSTPTRIRPEAIRVLEEIGVDASKQYAKPIEAVDTSRVDVVITLCAEEVCPYFPGNVRRVHWGLPDPAAVSGDGEARLEAFRKTRDELARRILVLAGRNKKKK